MLDASQQTGQDLRLDAALLSELMACDEHSFVQRAYWVLLGREPDPGGLVNYVDRLRSGTPKQEILLELARSPEGREKSARGARSVSAVALTPGTLRSPPMAGSWNELVGGHGAVFLNSIYQLLLGREADPEGARYYEARLRSGVSKVRVLCALRHSQEYRARTRLLQELLRALPDTARSTQHPGAETTPELCATPTLSDVLSYDDENLVRCLCSLALGTSGESQAYRDAMTRLREGLPPRRVLQSICASAPARRRRALLRRIDREIATYFLARAPVLGRLIGALLGVDGDSPLEMRLRRVEYRLLGSSEEPAGEWETAADATHSPASDSGGVAAPSPPGRSARPRARLLAGRESQGADAATSGSALRSLPAPADWGDN